jgi:hypothetical protein
LLAPSCFADWVVMLVCLFSCLQESENTVKSTTMVEQVDEYVDIGDEMPTATYQSMEIEKDAEVASGSGGSGSGSSSSSGMIRLLIFSWEISTFHELAGVFTLITICLLLLQVLSRGAQGTLLQELAMLILWCRGGCFNSRIGVLGRCDNSSWSWFSIAKVSCKYYVSCL